MRNLGNISWVGLQKPQQQRYPLLSVCTAFSCICAVVWLPVFGIFNVRTEVDINAYTMPKGAVKRQYPVNTPDEI